MEKDKIIYNSTRIQIKEFGDGSYTAYSISKDGVSLLFTPIEYNFITSLQCQDKLSRRNMQIRALKSRINSLENALRHHAPQSVLL
jgi:hypothetical protein